ncbi:MAG: hydroxyacid dehydrogenase [Deltaproteobacteria bacterium]|jgi:D-3-phosphoglycerate dehydrogenase|nr:hydroxyacid dehydrogenase [Deltaproteobacteria bacterium]
MKVFLTERIHPEAVSLLEQRARVIQGSSVEPEVMIREAQGCQGLLVRTANVSAEILKSLPDLKVVAKHGVGVDNIDLIAATKLGIQVLNSPFSNLNAVAEHALALTLALSKRLVLMDRVTRSGDFIRRDQYVNLELSEKTMGLVGLGKIASLLARKVTGLGMSVLAHDPYVKDEAAAALGAKLVTLDDLLSQSDFVSLHVPALESTRHLINETNLGQMKKTAFLINVARGPIVDEGALVRALNQGLIAGAALDVFDPEPPKPNNPLFAMDNVVLSPHNAALTDKALRAMAMDSAQGLIDFLSGGKPLYPVNSIEPKNHA